MSLSLVTFVWPDRNVGRTGICHMEWRKGWTVKQYLHSQPLREYTLLAMWKRCKAYNSDKERVRLRDIPKPGSAVVLQRVKR